MNDDFLCPCGSKNSYRECCKKYHDGQNPETPVKLVQARYSAYALSLADYIIQTTHPDNAVYSLDFAKWRENILKFSQNYNFLGVRILNFKDEGEKASVTFTAELKKGNMNASFTEKSFFVKVNDKWFYIRGAVI